MPVWWCPKLETVLANEEVVEGVSEVGGYLVERRPMRQWMLKITAYADRLLEDLEGLDWPENIKEMQRNWIGRSEGADVVFKVEKPDEVIKVFTTRPDTLFGATYIVLAPEHSLVDKLCLAERKAEVEKYRQEAARKSDLERTELAKDKTGVDIGARAINPVNGEAIPIWVSDYVLISYGSGAIMAVPGHDQRDWEFARQFHLPIVEVISGGNIEKEAYLGDGTLVNSPLIDGLSVEKAKEKITAWLEKEKAGKKAINYRLRDWLFSRQRYWGEPVPLLHLEDGSVVPLEEKELPLRLPEVESYEPSGDGQSPLAKIKEWMETKGPDGKPARREANTMPQWAGSCWYYLRYLDPKNDQQAWGKKQEKYWMPVDLYVGGAEHAVLHLLYARFWHKVLYDLGLVSTKEPFRKLVNQGMILGEDGEKLSKSRGKAINPDEVVAEHSADGMRLYEMFMGPLEKAKPWSTRGIEGVTRFLSRVWRLLTDESGEIKATIKDQAPGEEESRAVNRVIARVSGDIEGMHFNTAISAMMEFVNEAYGWSGLCRGTAEKLMLILSPFSPHLCEELWQNLGHEKSLAYESWPEYDAATLKEETFTLVVQISGKVRDKLECASGSSEDEQVELALGSARVAKLLAGKEIVKKISVKGRLVNLVIR